MKSTGVVRQVDQLGRIVIPKELRRKLDINEKDSLEIFTEHDMIILRKYAPQQACIITGEVSSNNKIFGNGNVVLSPKGMDILFTELEKSYSIKA